MDNPLAFAPIELALALSLVVGLAVASFVLVGASRSRFEWLPAVVTAVVAIVVPIVGPVVAIIMCRNLGRGRSRAAQPSS